MSLSSAIKMSERLNDLMPKSAQVDYQKRIRHDKCTQMQNVKKDIRKIVIFTCIP